MASALVAPVVRSRYMMDWKWDMMTLPPYRRSRDEVRSLLL